MNSYDCFKFYVEPQYDQDSLFQLGFRHSTVKNFRETTVEVCLRLYLRNSQQNPKKPRNHANKYTISNTTRRYILHIDEVDMGKCLNDHLN